MSEADLEVEGATHLIGVTMGVDTSSTDRALSFHYTTFSQSEYHSAPSYLCHVFVQS